MRRVAGALIIASTLAVLMTSIASAGGWSTVTVNSHPEIIYPDTEFIIEFTVLHHGMTPMDGLAPAITFTHADTGEAQTAKAVPGNDEGSYIAVVTLPAPGTWNWEIDAFGTHIMTPFNVADGPPAVASSSTASAISDRALPLTLLGVGVVTGLVALWSAGWIGLPGVFSSVPARKPKNPSASGNQ